MVKYGRRNIALLYRLYRTTSLMSQLPGIDRPVYARRRKVNPAIGCEGRFVDENGDSEDVISPQVRDGWANGHPTTKIYSKQIDIGCSVTIL